MDIRPIGNNTQPALGPADRNIAAPEPAKTMGLPVEPAAAVQQPAAIPTMMQVNQAVKNINKAMQDMAQGIEFSVDEDTHRTIVKVVDQQTKALIRQIPSEEILQIAKALDQAQGLLIRQKA